MKIPAVILVLVLAVLGFDCRAEDYSSDNQPYYSKEKRERDFYGETEQEEFDYLLEGFDPDSAESGYPAPELNGLTGYSDPYLGGYGYLSGAYEVTEYGQPTEDFYYQRNPQIPSPPTLPNILYQIMKRSRDR